MSAGVVGAVVVAGQPCPGETGRPERVKDRQEGGNTHTQPTKGQVTHTHSHTQRDGR